MKNEQFEKALSAFQDSYSDDMEYGISDEDAMRGLRAAFLVLGHLESVALADNALNDIKIEEARHKENRQIEEWARRNRLTPEERERESNMSAMLLNSKILMTNYLQRQFEPNLSNSWLSISDMIPPKDKPSA